MRSIVRRLHLTTASILLLASPAHASGPEWDQLHLPDLSEIRIAGDTIWLWSVPWSDTVTVGYYLVRPSSQWHRVVRIVPARTASAPARDSAVRFDGAVLRFAHDSTSGSVTLPNGRVVRLVPKASTTDLATLAGRSWSAEEGGPSMSYFPSAWVATPNAYWIGLSGGFSEGGGMVGGLLRVDRATGRLATLTHEWLARGTVTAIVAVGDTLFMGTASPGEYGAYGYIGLVAYEPARDRWRSVAAADSLLPDDRIVTLARIGDSLLVVTAKGPAIRSLANDRWTSWHFVPQLADSTVVLDLVPSRDTATTAELLATYLWQAEYVTRPRDFATRFDRLPPSRRAELARVGNPIDALRDTLFIPELAALLRSTSAYSRSEAAAALGRLDHPLIDGLLRPLLTDGDDKVAGAVAAALSSRGDRGARELVLQRFGGTERDVRWAMTVAKDAHDPLWVPELLRRTQLPPSDIGEAAYTALAQYRTADVIRALFRLAQTETRARDALFADFSDTTLAGSASWSSADSGIARRVVVLTLADAKAGPSAALGAARLATRLRIGPAIPRLIDVIHRNARGEPAAFMVGEMTAALVSLTGRTDAPTDDRDPEFVGRADAFWQRWRAAAGSALVQAVPRPKPVATAAATEAVDKKRRDAERQRVVAEFRAEERAADAAQSATAARMRKQAAGRGGWSALKP